MVNTAIIATKLSPPAARVNVLTRARILEKLEKASSRSLILISGPAGSGKTTVAAQWFYDRRLAGEAVCWLSLDDYDAEPVTFLNHIIAAVRTLYLDFGTKTQRIIEGTGIRSMERIATELRNELVQLNQPVVLFLDDYSRASSNSTDEYLQWLIEHQPDNLLLVIVTRTFYSKHTPSLRIQEKLLEIGFDELRFNDAETAKYLNNTKGLNVSPVALKTLHERSEGWIAGLQLVSVLMRDDTQGEQFLNSFSGTLRDISDYLSAEVLAAQSDTVQDFMLRSAVLTRMCGKACDDILDIQDSKKILQELEIMNLFIVPLDENRKWYRYHTLFRQFLLEQLQIRLPGCEGNLYQRAANWFQQAVLPNEAIDYAISAGDDQKVAEIMHLGSFDKLSMQGNLSLFNAWREHLPDTIKQHNLKFLATECFLLLHKHQLTIARRVLFMLQEKVKSYKTQHDQAISENYNIDCSRDTSRVLTMIVAYMEDDLTSLQTVNCDPDELNESFLQGFVYRMQGYTCLSLGEFEQAHEKLQMARFHQQNANAIWSIPVTESFLALVRLMQGRHRDALEYLRDAELSAVNIHDGQSYPLATVRVLKAVVLYDMNELDEALALLKEHLHYLDYTGHILIPALGYTTLAKCYAMANDSVSARNTLDQLAELAGIVVSDRITSMIESVEVQFLSLLSEEMDREVIDIDKNKIPSEAKLTCSTWNQANSIRSLTLCRLLMMQEREQEALEIVEGLHLQDVTAGAHLNELQCLILKACILSGLHREQQAVTAMVKALEKAYLESCTRLFIDEGNGVKIVLQKLLQNNKQLEPDIREFAQDIYDQFSASETANLLCNNMFNINRKTATNDKEILSEREREVMDLLAVGKPNYLIADVLQISENTVKFHVKRIFSKLNVRNRTAAVSEAKNQGILI